MITPRSAREYLVLAKKASLADPERVAEALRNQALTVLWTSAPADASTGANADGGGKAIDLQAGAYVGSRFDCLVEINFSNYGDLCLVTHSGVGGRSLLPRSVDLDAILMRAGWQQISGDDITTILDEDTDADVLGTFFNMY